MNQVKVWKNNELIREGNNIVCYYGITYLVQAWLNHLGTGEDSKPGRLKMGDSDETINTPDFSNDLFLTDVRGNSYGFDPAEWGVHTFNLDDSVIGELKVNFDYQDYQLGSNPLIREFAIFPVNYPQCIARFVVEEFELEPGTDISVSWILNFIEAT